MAVILPNRRLAGLHHRHLRRRLHRPVLRAPVRQRHDLPVGRLHAHLILLVPHYHATYQGKKDQSIKFLGLKT